MIILNFSHPLTAAQLEQAAELARQAVTQVIELPVQFDHQQPFLPQLEQLVSSIPLQGAEWQNEAILVNPPSLNFITALLLAELHGRMGYFPSILRLRPVADSLPPRYEVGEILNLQAVRDAARKRRGA
jgi:hypothetical protein